ncbi:unnamed protein product, partial [Symbiodinium sp. CCMP2456]
MGVPRAFRDGGLGALLLRVMLLTAARVLRSTFTSFTLLVHRLFSSEEKVAGKLEVNEMQQAVANVGCGMLPNCPVDQDPGPTPSDAGPPKTKCTFAAEAAHLGFGALVGALFDMSPFSWYTEKDDQLVHTVAPKLGQQTAAANFGASEGFGLHQERAVDRHPLNECMPAIQMLNLFVVRGDPA